MPPVLNIIDPKLSLISFLSSSLLDFLRPLSTRQLHSRIPRSVHLAQGAQGEGSASSQPRMPPIYRRSSQLPRCAVRAVGEDRRFQTAPLLLESSGTFCSCARQCTGDAWTLFWSRTPIPLPLWFSFTVLAPLRLLAYILLLLLPLLGLLIVLPLCCGNFVIALLIDIYLLFETSSRPSRDLLICSFMLCCIVERMMTQVKEGMLGLLKSRLKVRRGTRETL